MRKTRDEQPYQAFLVRCWQEENGWRYSLEAIGSGTAERRRQQGFESLDTFLAALKSDLLRLTDPAEDVTDGNDG